MGLGGATVVSILGRADGQAAPRTSDKSDGRQRLGYNPALEARGIREEDFDAVRSRKAFCTWAAESFGGFEKKTRTSSL